MSEESAFTSEQLGQILEEVAGYEVKLSEDPTQPHLGHKYLQQKIAQCRGFLNRVQFYIQKVGKHEKDLRLRVNLKELDIEFKINQKLADDPLVRQQPSIGDRKALAIAQLKTEHEELAQLKIDLMDAQETLKLLKMKYGDLRGANTDIKAQRQLVKDDMQAWSEGDEGYTKPQAAEDGTVPDGMAPPVTDKIDPKDVLDPNKPPEDLPSPRDAVHAKQISEFLNSGSVKSASDEVPEPPISYVSYNDLLKNS